jgi:homoserine dehydrogenase
MTEEGVSYQEALKEAQQLGYAEFNPTADVDGYDAMYKLSILSSLAFHTCIPYECIYREGITKVYQEDIAFGKNTGYKIKLLAIGKKNGKNVEVRVHPTLISESHPLASVSGAFNAVFLNGDFVDNVMLYGRGAGAYPTGSAIVSDVVYCALKSKHVYTDFENNGKVSEDVNIVSDFESKYYVNVIVDDKPGVLASISSVWGKNGVSIRFINQSAFTQKDYVPIVIMTHTTSENTVQKTLKEIASLPCVREIRSVIRVID